jgi:cellulose synthase/poly-beta-1,6-N-acetylglucosamine synthase-like glycosyltransferase
MTAKRAALAQRPRIAPRAQAETVSIVIPSWTGEVGRLLASIERQSFRDYSVRVVEGVSPAARARRLGVEGTGGSLLLFVDDDAYLGHERVLEILVETLQSDPTIGVVGSSKLLPPDASWLQRRIACEVPRWVYPVVERDTESNPPIDRYGFTGITTTCCLVRRSVFEEVGGFDESLTTAEDTDFFYRVRRLGYRFVIPAGCWVYHDPPGSLTGLLRKSFRYGVNHALEARKAPERRMDLVPLDRWYGKLFLALTPAFFIPSIFVNGYFDPVRHVRAGLMPLKALSTYATFYGYCWGWFRGAP